MQNFINFIKYNNAFTFIAILLFIATASTFAASPELREDAIKAVISQKQEVLSLDNTKLLAQDFGKFDSKLQIKEIKEDSENYYVKYGFKTFVIRDYIWQEDGAEKTLSVSRSFLVNKDLGLYTAQELGEVVDYNLSYLKEAQEIEKKKGETNKVIAVEYGGLIGKFLNSKEKEFSDYQPVVEDKKTFVLSVENPSVNVTASQTPSATTPQSATAVVIPDKEMIRQMVQEAIREILENKTNATSSSSSSSLEAVLSSSSSSLTAISSSSVADTSSSLSLSPAESTGAESSAVTEASSLSSSSAISETASSSSDSFSSTSASSSSLPTEASLSLEESNQSSSQEPPSDSSEVYSSEASSSSEPTQ